jgi:intermediate peptidase
MTLTLISCATLCYRAWPQIFYSIMDLTLFGEHTSKPLDTISAVADLKRRHTSWNYVEGTHWHTRFSHLINYGAGRFSSYLLVP